jgi:hypothetical protein
MAMFISFVQSWISMFSTPSVEYRMIVDWLLAQPNWGPMFWFRFPVRDLSNFYPDDVMIVATEVYALISLVGADWI